MKERPSSQMSAPMPENSSSVASGGYMNQPACGAAPKKIEPQTKTPPRRKLQKPKAESRGNGRSRAREHAGQQVDRHRLEDRHGEEEHHHRAVQGEGLVVEVGGDERVVGHGELGAHEERQAAGEEHEDEGGGAVPEADLGVVDRRPVAPAFRQRPGGPEPRLLLPPLARSGAARSSQAVQPGGERRELVRRQHREARHGHAGLHAVGGGDEAGDRLGRCAAGSRRRSSAGCRGA